MMSRILSCIAVWFVSTVYAFYGGSMIILRKFRDLKVCSPKYGRGRDYCEGPPHLMVGLI